MAATRFHLPPGSRGLTLIEVLVALAVVAVTLAAGLKAAGALASNTDRFADVVAAQWCADNQLTALKLSRQFPAVGDGDFACEQAGRSYPGKMIVRPTPNPNFRRVDTRIGNEAGHTLLTQSTVLPRF
jgi:general secretion pathway protein I